MNPRRAPAPADALPDEAWLTSLAAPLLLLAPHYDDEVLGAGKLLAALVGRLPLAIAFCTDGMADASRAPEGAAIGARRRAESEQALARLAAGAPFALHHLGLPEGRLTASRDALARELADLWDACRPGTAIVPFRYDKHPDHLAVSAAARALAARDGVPVLESFVYWRWALLPGHDVRHALRPEHLVGLRATPERRTRQLAALHCFTSQTTCHLPGQPRPVLSADLLDTVCDGPERFLRAPHPLADAGLFRLPRALVRLLCAVEPPLKNAKERLRRLARRRCRPTAAGA